MCVKVFLAEDSELVCRAIRILLSEREDITVVGKPRRSPKQFRGQRNYNLMKSSSTCTWLTAKKSVYPLARNC